MTLPPFAIVTKEVKSLLEKCFKLTTATKKNSKASNYDKSFFSWYFYRSNNNKSSYVYRK